MLGIKSQVPTVAQKTPPDLALGYFSGTLFSGLTCNHAHLPALSHLDLLVPGDHQADSQTRAVFSLSPDDVPEPPLAPLSVWPLSSYMSYTPTFLCILDPALSPLITLPTFQHSGTASTVFVRLPGSFQCARACMWSVSFCDLCPVPWRVNGMASNTPSIHVCQINE